MRLSLALAVVVVLLSVWCVHLVAAQGFQLCTFTDPTTSKKYDLTNLAKLYTSKASATDPDSSGWKYYNSPCQPVRGEPRCVSSDASTAMCQQDAKDVFAVGVLSKGTVGPLANGGEGFMVSFTAVNTRGSKVSYICDAKAGEGKIKWTYIPPSGSPQPYIWEFEWRTSYACPTGGGGGGGGGGGSSDSGGLAGGWIFIICLVSVTFVYFVGGLVLQKFYFKREGLEIIPNSQFWLALPGLVKRMCGRGYQQI
ncbi:Autophagy-related protein 27 protein [Acanthamoeba castellanii str. Neff]|uniref:Autophagy-related protein 27 n=1 Tax=Acanthamoeba castellanii (strain ATCC 30010 / Neff) TaxID=1257118 RepID=L8GFX5_ACACF|nr:Autophagy-related protein 27 protein [Acanthamoeba castellanii str. Neff]ELR11076.1 Autophagy-related protein 27 protein [Acanthamoeba castellanii str. Neff]